MHVTRLPQVHGNAAIAAQGEQSPFGTARAVQFAAAWMVLLEERALLMRSDSRLVYAAQLHALFLAQRTDTQPSMHIGLLDSTPNQRVRAARYRLPLWHLDGNTVESAKRTWEDLDDDMLGIVSRLMAHETHRAHMLGLGFWEPSVVYGVGAASEPSGSTYFVCVAAPVEEA